MSAVVALCHFCEFHGPSVLLVTVGAGPAPPLTGAGRGGGADCERCSSLSTTRSLLTSSHHCQTFLSTQSGARPELQALVRTAAIRALSCEVSQAREGPLLFADPTVSTVLANNFFLKDSGARGFQRYYSIMVLSRERELLLSNFERIIHQLNLVIEPLKNSALNKYNSEIRQEKTYTKPKRTSISAARSLTELTDVNIYENLHRDFSLLLVDIAQRVKEELVTGQLMKSSVTSSPPASLALLCSLQQQLGGPGWRGVLHCVLAGRPLHLASSDQVAASRVAESLCLLLPSSPEPLNHPANLVLGTNTISTAVAQLAVPQSHSQQHFTFTCPDCTCDHLQSGLPTCKYCRYLYESNFFAKYSKILQKNQIPAAVQEMKTRSFIEQILLQARAFVWLSRAQRTSFLSKNNLTAVDAEILIFFSQFS